MSSGSLVARGSSGNGGQVKVKTGGTGKVTIDGRVDADGPAGAGGAIAITGEQVEIRRAIAVTADGTTEGGRIEIGSDAPPGSYAVDASETVIAGILSADSSIGKGGLIRLGGHTLMIEADALVSASGAIGGGRIDAGAGDFGSTLAASSHILIDCGALLAANATENGQGGQVMVVSANDRNFQGSLQARGGSWAGDGGQAVLSAGESLIIDRLARRVDLTASAGTAGHLRVQSSEFVISSPGRWARDSWRANFLNAADVADFLNTADITVQTQIGAGGGNGNIYVKGRVGWNSVNSLTINADCDVLILCVDGRAGVIDALGGGGVTINAARSVLLDAGSAIRTTTGNVVINANQRLNPATENSPGITLGGSIRTRGGDVSLTGVGVTSTGGTVNAGYGTILVDGNDGAINLVGALTTTNGSAAAVRIVDATTVTLGDITTGSEGTVALGGAGGDSLSGTVTQTGAINAGTLIGNTGSMVTLNCDNMLGNLGPFTSTGAFAFNDTSGGLNVTGNVVTHGGKATIATAGGALALGNSNITTGGGDVSLTGVGVTSTGGTVNAGSGAILVDGNDGAINLAGALTTMNETATAVKIVDATTATLGNISTGATGTVVLGEAGEDHLSGAVTQTGIINAGTLTGNTGNTVTLNGSNTVGSLGPFTNTGAFVFNDTTGGLNMTGNLMTHGGSATIATAGGALALGDSNVTTGGGDVSLTGVGVTSTGGTVDAGAGTITVDGNDGAINLAGALTTANGSATAVKIVDATTARLGNITTGSAGTVVLGGAGADNLSGAVSQTGAINAGTLTGNTGSTVTLDGSNTVVNLGEFQNAEAFMFNDTTDGLNVTGNVVTHGGKATVTTAGGVLALGASNIMTGGGDVSLTGVGVTSAGGTVDAGAGTITVDGNEGAINLAGALTTTNETATAVKIVDATTATLGNISTGATGTVVLGGAGGDNLSGAVTQTGIINAGTLTGQTGNTVTLDGNNTVVNLGEFTSAEAFAFNDTTGGLNVTGNVVTHGGKATIATAGGALALGDSNITTGGGDVSLTGVGVTSTGGTVNAGSGAILVDGNDGAINLAGALTTTNETATAVKIVDATTATLGNITTGAAGTVVLGGAGGDNLSGAVTQTGVINAGTLTGNTGSTVTLNGSNTVGSLGPFTNTGAFAFNDTTDGLNVTGNVVTQGGKATITTAGGALALGGSNITTAGGDVSLTGVGVTSAAGTVNAGSGAISVDGNDGAINLAGALTTTNETARAVKIVDAATATLGDITTGAAGTMVLDDLSGAVTQTGSIHAGGLILTGNGSYTLTGAANAIGAVATVGTVGSLSLVNSAGLVVGSVGAVSGLSVAGDLAITTGANPLLILNNVASQGGAVTFSAASIGVNGASVSSTGNAPVTLTAGQLVLFNQPVINGVFVGSGGTAQFTLVDSNLTTGENYTISAGQITAGSRNYAFQDVSAIRMDLGPGNDHIATDFFSFTQMINANSGSNKLLVEGIPVTASPLTLTKPGFGTITYTQVLLSAIALPNTSFGAVLLQNATPGSGPTSGSSSQTNNFNSTGTAGATPGVALAGLGAGGSAAALSGGLAAGLTGSISQNLGLMSAGGGAPPSFGLQSQMNATTSAATESELSRALGGDGTMGVRSSTGLVSVDPGSGPPSPLAMAQLDEGFSLLALSELSFGALGFTQVTVTNQMGEQSMVLSGPPPTDTVRQKLAQTATPESFSTLFASLGGDGTARIDSVAGSIAIDLKGKSTPAYIEARLETNMTPGAFGELALALGGAGEFIVNSSHGLAIMDASGYPPGPQVPSAVLALLAAAANSQLSLVLGEDGAGLVLAWDGIQGTAFDAALPGPLVIAQLNAATSPQSMAELDTATR